MEIYGISLIRPMNSPDQETLLSQLTSGDDQEAEAAAIALADQGVDVIPSLQRLLHSPEPETRWWATRALAELDSPQVTPLLIKSLQDVDIAVRQCAALALSFRPHHTAVTHLIACLDNPDRLLAHLAAYALVASGEAAVPALLEVMQTGPQPARLEAVRALALIGDHRSIPVLFEALDDDSALIEYWADEGLQRMGIGMTFFKP
jgi:HEAT repeat protein